MRILKSLIILSVPFFMLVSCTSESEKKAIETANKEDVIATKLKEYEQMSNEQIVKLAWEGDSLANVMINNQFERQVNAKRRQNREQEAQELGLSVEELDALEEEAVHDAEMYDPPQ